MRAGTFDFETIFADLGKLVRDVRTPVFSTGLEHLMRALFEPQSIVVLVFENRKAPGHGEHMDSG